MKPANGSALLEEEIKFESAYLWASGRCERYGFSFGVDDEEVEVMLGMVGGGPGGGPGGWASPLLVAVFAFFEGLSFSADPILAVVGWRIVGWGLGWEREDFGGDFLSSQSKGEHRIAGVTA